MQFETLCADAYLNPELNQIMIKAPGWMTVKANGEFAHVTEVFKLGDLLYRNLIPIIF